MIGVGRRGCPARREEQRGLALAGLGRVGAVDHVLADRDREVAADRAGGGLERVGRADHLAGGADRGLALEDERDDRAGGDELDELAEERLAVVLGVVLLGEVLGDRHVLGGDDRQALALEAGDDLTGEPARERVGLDQDQGSFMPWGVSVATLAADAATSGSPAASEDVSPVPASAGSGCATSAATVAWSVV